MNSLEELLLNTGFSWQLSKLLPFVIILLLGLSLGFLLFKRLKSRLMKPLLALFIGIALSGAYFAFYPIYVSDLNNEFRLENYVPNNQYNQAFIEVIVLPDCPHCLNSTDLIRKLISRNKDLRILYKIVTNDTYGGSIEEKLKMEGMKYSYSAYDANIKILAKGSFPSFVFHEKGSKNVQIWNNNTFGSKALDDIESKL